VGHDRTGARPGDGRGHLLLCDGTRVYTRRKGLAGRALALACMRYGHNFMNSAMLCYEEQADDDAELSAALHRVYSSSPFYS
jgi:hypothetical protein